MSCNKMKMAEEIGTLVNKAQITIKKNELTSTDQYAKKKEKKNDNK